MKRADSFDFVWDDAIAEYPSSGEPGIFSLVCKKMGVDVDALLFYDKERQLSGVLWHYPQDIPIPESEKDQHIGYSTDRGYVLECAGNFTVFVHPERRRAGIGIALIREADKRWVLDFEQQEYSTNGAALANSYLREREKTETAREIKERQRRRLLAPNMKEHCRCGERYRHRLIAKPEEVCLNCGLVTAATRDGKEPSRLTSSWKSKGKEEAA